MRGHRGFTFIELTISIAIIAVLAAILFPVFARAREKARQIDCNENLRQIAVALSMYARDHAGHLPPSRDDLAPLLGRYLPQAEVLECPSAARDRDQGETETGALAVDYYYRPGFCDDDDPTTLIVADSDLSRHNEGANALFLDGHVKWSRDPRQSSGGGYYGGRDDPLKVLMEERDLQPILPEGVDPSAAGGVSP